MASLERFLFYLLIFSLPFQTRTLVYQWGAVLNEYQAAFFYFTDLLIGLVFISWLWRSVAAGTFTRRNFLNSHSDVLLITFFAVAGVSLFVAQNAWLGFYQWLKLAEFILLFFYVKNNFSAFNIAHAFWVLLSSAVLQALIADSQWHNQASLGLKLLGESVLDPNLAGVAKLEVGGMKLIRAYGTLPHPNVLAAFLLTALFGFYYLYLSDKKPYHPIQLAEWLKFLAFFILLLGLFLTFSRLTIIVFVLISLAFFWLSKTYRPDKEWEIFQQRRQVLLFLFVIFAFIFLFLMRPEMLERFGQTNFSEQSVALRQTYHEIAATMIAENPLLGVGLGNFTARMNEFMPGVGALKNWMIQPVHNIYLLVTAETGVIGLFFFLWFLVSVIIRAAQSLAPRLDRLTLFFIVAAFLFIGLFDHFFWTLQQGSLMLWIMLALLAGTTHANARPRS